MVLSGGSGPVSAAWRRREATGSALRTFLAQATGARTAGFSRIAHSAAKQPQDMPLSEVLAVLDDAENEKREFSVFTDLR